jgi:hypothetical protein
MKEPPEIDGLAKESRRTRLRRLSLVIATNEALHRLRVEASSSTMERRGPPTAASFHIHRWGHTPLFPASDGASPYQKASPHHERNGRPAESRPLASELLGPVCPGIEPWTRQPFASPAG